jgi:signal transduction histidine kinase
VILLHRRDAVLQDLVEEVTSIQQIEAEQKGIDFRVTLHEDPLLVSVDPQRMTQVITNLVINAINYTDTGGAISVELTLDDSEPHPRAVLRVKDTGIGIKPEMVDHVFEPFFRAEEKAAVGTGLGLTIARDIVVMHGGTISVESTEGEGSTFTVTLDLVE